MHATELISLATIREFRRGQGKDLSREAFDGLIRAYLPLIHGTAKSLIPENPASVEIIIPAAFELFAFRFRRLPKRTVVATWLLQTTWLAAQRERARLRLPRLTKGSVYFADYTLIREVLRLRTRCRDSLILSSIQGESIEFAARAMRVKPSRAEKLQRQAFKRIAKRLKKRKVEAELSAQLAAIVQLAPLELESLVIEDLRNWSPKKKKGDQLRGIIRGWQWLGIKRQFRRLAVGLGIFFCILGSLAGTFAWLARHGYLTAWFIQHGAHQLVKEIPELGVPARPWPVTAADQAIPTQTIPTSASEFYARTNIWISKFFFTNEQWKRIAPSHVAPVPDLMGGGGHIALRNPKAHRNGLAGALGIDFNWTEAKLEIANLTFSKVAIRYRGNGTYVNSLFGPKQSFKVDLNKDEKAHNLAGVHTLNLVNSIPDNSYVHDALAEELFHDLGVPGPRTAYTYLTIDAPGYFTNQAIGLYVLMENIDSDFAVSRFGSKKTPIFKPVTYELFKDLGSDWNAYAGIYDLKTKATQEQEQRVIDFARLVTSASDADFSKKLGEYLDIDEFAAFLAGHVLLSSYDGFLANGQNYYVYLNPLTKKFGFISWDQDHAWGEFGYVGTAESREHASIWHPSAYSNRFLDRVLKVESFRTSYRKQLEQAIDNIFTVERLYPKIDQIGAIIRPAVAAESEFRLKRFDLALSTNWISGLRDTREAEGPKAPVHQIKRFIVNRAKSVRDQLAGKEEGTKIGQNPFR
ncbi:MAG: Inner spore coat protein [Verrucomicrobiales bacterium]|nr:Inner spore coat protein [Verrucomicrobiales bacterium]